MIWINAFAQKSDTTKLYTDASMKAVDAKDATFKFSYYKKAPNQFILEMFDKNNNILKSESYLDSLIQIKQGPFIEYIAENPSVKGSYLNNQFHGDFSYYNKGILKRTAKFENNLLNGAMTEYFANGQPELTGQFSNGKKIGEWKGYLVSGRHFKTQNFDNDKLVDEFYYDENGKKFKKEEYERVPQFYGGTVAFSNFISQNLKYPKEAIKNRTQGKVIVSFVIDFDGSVINVKISRGVDMFLDDEAKRIIELSPKWMPGLQNGKPVKVAYSVPITFSL